MEYNLKNKATKPRLKIGQYIYINFVFIVTLVLLVFATTLVALSWSISIGWSMIVIYLSPLYLSIYLLVDISIVSLLTGSMLKRRLITPYPYQRAFIAGLISWVLISFIMILFISFSDSVLVFAPVVLALGITAASFVGFGVVGGMSELLSRSSKNNIGCMFAIVIVAMLIIAGISPLMTM